jgi:hypothetical protein
VLGAEGFDLLREPPFVLGGQLGADPVLVLELEELASALGEVCESFRRALARPAATLAGPQPGHLQLPANGVLPACIGGYEAKRHECCSEEALARSTGDGTTVSPVGGT